MRKRTVIAGILCGLVCAGCVFAYTVMVQSEADSARVEAMERYGGEQVEVLVATRDILPGETIDSENATMKLWVADLLPENSITDESEAWGKRIASYVVEGEVITSKRFESQTSTVEVPEGMVALSLPAEDVQAVGGAVFVGAKVDVYAVGTQTTCLGRGLTVLATSAGDDTSSGSSVTWVTLALPPDKTQEFVSASETMEIYYALPAESSDSDSEEAASE